MSFGEALTDLRGCPGVLSMAISDTDGIPVESWGGSKSEIEEMLAEYSTFLREVASANRELQLGGLDQLVIAAEKRVVVVTQITDLYFLIAIVERGGNPGKARFVSRVAAHRLRHEFI